MSYFPPPPIAETQIFSRLPDRYRRRGACAWGEANRPHFETDSVLAGPAFAAEGRRYVTDIPYGRVFRVGEGDDWELVAEYDGWPNGLKFDRDGAAVIADYKHGLMRLDVASGKVDPLLTSAGSEGFKGVNDLAFGPDGTIYFTDQGQTGMHDPTGRVYALEPSGALRRLLDTGPSPNGIALHPGGHSLMVAMTRANQVWRIPLNPSGLISKVGVFANLHGGMAGPDGLAFSDDGMLFVAHAGVGMVWALDALAKPVLGLRSAAGSMPTNLVFGGPGRKQLYITESETGSILVADVPATVGAADAERR